MSSARAIFSVQAVISLYLFYLLSYKLTKNKIFSWLMPLLLIATSLFWERSFRVRSDLIILLINLIILNLIYSDHWSSKKKIISFSLMIASLFITPKSILLSGILVTVYYDKFFAVKRVFNKKVALMLLFSGVVIALIVLKTNQTALDYFLQSFSATGLGYTYFSSQRFEYLTGFADRNLWVIACLFLPFISLYRHKIKCVDPQYFNFSMALVILLIVFPNRLPFFIYSLFPFILLGLLANPFVIDITNKAKHKRVYKIGFTFVCVGLVYVSVNRAKYILHSHNNYSQKEFQSTLCEYLETMPDVKVLDPVGVCPKRKNSLYKYFGPFHNNETHFEAIRAIQPEIILNVAKMLYVHPKLDDLLVNNYFYSDKGIFHKFTLISNKEVSLATNDLKLKLKRKLTGDIGDYRVTYKNYIGKERTGDINIDPETNLPSIKIRPKDKWQILNSFEIIKISPFAIDKLVLPKNMNALFRHDAEL